MTNSANGIVSIKNTLVLSSKLAFGVEMVFKKLSLMCYGPDTHFEECKYLIIGFRHPSFYPAIDLSLMLLLVKSTACAKIEISLTSSKVLGETCKARHASSHELVTCILKLNIAIHDSGHSPIGTKADGCYGWAGGCTRGDMRHCTFPN